MCRSRWGRSLEQCYMISFSMEMMRRGEHRQAAQVRHFLHTGSPSKRVKYSGNPACDSDIIKTQVDHNLTMETKLKIADDWEKIAEMDKATMLMDFNMQQIMLDKSDQNEWTAQDTELDIAMGEMLKSVNGWPVNEQLPSLFPELD